MHPLSTSARGGTTWGIRPGAGVRSASRSPGPVRTRVRSRTSRLPACRAPSRMRCSGASRSRGVRRRGGCPRWLRGPARAASRRLRPTACPACAAAPNRARLRRSDRCGKRPLRPRYPRAAPRRCACAPRPGRAARIRAAFAHAGGAPGNAAGIAVPCSVPPPRGGTSRPARQTTALRGRHGPARHARETRRHRRVAGHPRSGGRTRPGRAFAAPHRARSTRCRTRVRAPARETRTRRRTHRARAARARGRSARSPRSRRALRQTRAPRRPFG